MRATDANPTAIAKARAGLYGAWSFRGVPTWLITRYFRSHDGSFRLAHDAVRRAVTFEISGIAQEAARMPTGSLDVVLFRNVAIYLQPDNLIALYRELRRVLRPDGLLVVGHSDPRPGASLFVRCSDADHTAFRPAPDEIPRTDRPTHRPPAMPMRRRRRALRRTPVRTTLAEPRLPTPPAAPAAAPIDPTGLPALADGGQRDTALAQLGALLREDPTSARLHALRGRVLLDAGDVDEAVHALRRAVFLAPEDLLARFWYAQALGAARQPAAALRQLDEVERRLHAGAGADLEGTSPDDLLDAVRLFQEGLR